jgi:hypothetical protein
MQLLWYVLPLISNSVLPNVLCLFKFLSILTKTLSKAIVGLLLGPVYPCAAAVFTHNTTVFTDFWSGSHLCLWKQWGRSSTLHDRHLSSSCRYICPSSYCYWAICGHACILVRNPEC